MTDLTPDLPGVPDEVPDDEPDDDVLDDVRYGADLPFDVLILDGEVAEPVSAEEWLAQANIGRLDRA